MRTGGRSNIVSDGTEKGGDPKIAALACGEAGRAYSTVTLMVAANFSP